MNKRTRWTALKESVFGVPKTPIIIKYNTTPVLGVVQQGYTIFVTSPSFLEMVNVYNSDSVLKEAIDDFADQVVMTGFFTKMNKDYTLVLNGKTAKEFIDEWNESNDMQEKVDQIATEVYAYGNSIWQLTPEDGFSNVPIEAIWRALPIDPKVALQSKYNLQLTPMYNSMVINFGEFIHFRTHVKSVGHTYSGSAPFGIGLVSPMLARPTSQDGTIIAPSIYEMRLALRTDLMEGFKKFSFGNSVYCFPGMNNDDFAASGLADLISGMSSTGNRIATNADGKILLEVPERTQSYDAFIKRMSDEFLMSIADPSLKMGLEMGFTKSTAETGMALYKYKIEAMRRIIAYQLEKIWEQILTTSGYDGKAADIHMVFGQETTEYTMQDLFSAVDKSCITPNEFRDIAIKYFKWEISGQIKNGEQPKGQVEQAQALQVLSQSKDVSKDEPKAPVKEADVPPSIQVVELSDAIARYNKDLTTIYIDPSVDKKYYTPLIAHEIYEYNLEFGPIKMPLQEAESRTSRFTEFICQQNNINIDEYNAKMIECMKIIEARSPRPINPSDVVKR